MCTGTNIHRALGLQEKGKEKEKQKEKKKQNTTVGVYTRSSVTACYLLFT